MPTQRSPMKGCRLEVYRGRCGLVPREPFSRISRRPVGPAPRDPAIRLSAIALLNGPQPAVKAHLTRVVSTVSRLDPDWELIFVNGGGAEATFEALRVEAAGEPRIRLLDRGGSRGPGFELREGFGAARGDWIITLDFAPEHSPDQMSALLRTLRGTRRPDIVLASSHHPEGRVEGFQPWRRAAKAAANALLRRVLRGRIHTTNCAFRGYRSDAIRQLPLRADGHEVHLELVSLAFRRGMSVAETPAVERFVGTPRQRHFWRRLRDHAGFALRERPTLMWGVAGLLLAGSGVCGVLGMSLAGFRDGRWPAGFPLAFFSLLVLAGVEILGITFLFDQQAARRSDRRYRVEARRRRLALGRRSPEAYG